MNRFDDVLAQFNKHYGLEKGPQTVTFGSAVVSDTNVEQDKGQAALNAEEQDSKDETDVELIKAVCYQSRTIEFRIGQDGKDRLRVRENWVKWVLPPHERDPS